MASAHASLARLVLDSVQRAADRERQSIWSATADVIDVYTTGQALDSCERSNWDPHQVHRLGRHRLHRRPRRTPKRRRPLVVALIEAVRDAHISGTAPPCWQAPRTARRSPFVTAITQSARFSPTS
jgi:hypothetical protein